MWSGHFHRPMIIMAQTYNVVSLSFNACYAVFGYGSLKNLLRVHCGRVVCCGLAATHSLLFSWTTTQMVNGQRNINSNRFHCYSIALNRATHSQQLSMFTECCCLVHKTSDLQKLRGHHYYTPRNYLPTDHKIIIIR